MILMTRKIIPAVFPQQQYLMQFRRLSGDS